MKVIYIVAIVLAISLLLVEAQPSSKAPKPTRSNAQRSGGPQKSLAPSKPAETTITTGGLIAPNPQCAWTYDGNTGPYFWSSFCSKDCGGDAQSPIDILPHYTSPNQGLGQIFTNYTDSASTIAYDGRNLIITPVSSAGFGTLKQLPNLSYLQNAQKYVFRSAKVHATSEHTIYGMPFNAELHMVHTAVINGSVNSHIVVCVFFSIGQNSSKILDPILKSISGYVNGTSSSTTTGTTASFTSIAPVPWNTSFPLLKDNMGLNANASYFHYVGSLSTPPCTKQVNHFIFKEPLSMSQDQYNTLYKLLNDKNRPLQRQNQRPVYFYNARSAASSLTVPFWASFVQWLF